MKSQRISRIGIIGLNSRCVVDLIEDGATRVVRKNVTTRAVREPLTVEIEALAAKAFFVAGLAESPSEIVRAGDQVFLVYDYNDARSTSLPLLSNPSKAIAICCALDAALGIVDRRKNIEFDPTVARVSFFDFEAETFSDTPQYDRPIVLENYSSICQAIGVPANEDTEDALHRALVVIDLLMDGLDRDGSIDAPDLSHRRDFLNRLLHDAGFRSEGTAHLHR